MSDLQSPASANSWYAGASWSCANSLYAGASICIIWVTGNKCDGVTGTVSPGSGLCRWAQPASDTSSQNWTWEAWPSGRLRHGIYHFQLVYTIDQMICTIWYIPYGIYHDIYHGIYHAKTVYTVRYTVIYTTRYIPRYIPWYMSRYISWYIPYGIYRAI